MLQGGFWGTILSAIVTFILAIGQMTTKGSVKNTRLPSAPTDSCPAVEVASFLANITLTNMTSDSYVHNLTSTMSSLADAMTQSDASPYDYPEPYVILCCSRLLNKRLLG